MTDRQREPGKPGRPTNDRPRLFQRPGHENWWFYYRRKCLSARTPNRAEAERYAKAYAAKDDSLRSGVAYSDVTVGDALAFYENWLSENDFKKIRRVRLHIKALRQHFGSRRIVDLDQSKDGLDFAAAQRRADGGRRLTNGSIRTYISSLNRSLRAFRSAHESAGLPELLIQGPPKDPPTELWLTRGEVARLLWAARGRIWDLERGDWKRHPPVVPYRLGCLQLRSAEWRARVKSISRLIILGAYTGSRFDVLMNVGWFGHPEHGHIEFADGRAIIHRAGWAHEETTKGRRETVLPRQARVLARLWRHNDDLPDPLTLKLRNPSRTVVNIEGRRATSAPLRSRWIAVAKAAGFNLEGAATTPGGRRRSQQSPWISPHVLRHTCATWMIQGGAPVEDAARHLDVTTEVFQKTYLQISPDFAMEAALALDPAWFRRAIVLRTVHERRLGGLPPEGKA